MKNKGYTIMEAVIAMFLVVVMVGAVFSAMMSSRRAIVTSSEREELFYSLNSAYGMLKDCRSNPASCHLKSLNCFSNMPGTKDLKDCNELFTFNFQNLCKNAGAGVFQYKATVSDTPLSIDLSNVPNFCQAVKTPQIEAENLYVLELEARCMETL